MPRYALPVAVLLQSARKLALAVAGALLMLTAPAVAAPNHIAAALVAEVAPDGTATLAIAMSPAPGWHGYWLNPGDAGYAMRLAWHLPAGASVGAPRYPVPQALLIAGLMNHVFAHDYAVLVPFTAPAGVAKGKRLPVSVDAEWLACSASICVPEHATLSTTVAAGPADPRFDGWRAALPAPLGAPVAMATSGGQLRLAIPLPASVALPAPHVFVAADNAVAPAAPQRFSRRGDTLIVDLTRADPAAVAPASLDAVLAPGDGGGFAFTATPGAVPPDGAPLAGPAPATPLALLVLAAIAGGLILNVMPCVFPILSLKALSLARAGGDGAHARAEGLAYSAGVVLACTALGGLLLGLRAGGAAVGWAFQLQDPLVVAALLALAVAITANLLGLFEFAVPGFAARGSGLPGQRGSTANAFATGLLAAFVATPCTGPFMAGAMGAALVLPWLPALLIFAGLGFGLALPFVALAFVPPLRRLLPRPGAWMAWFRRAMAVPMALTALALLWLASRLAGTNFAGLAGVISIVLIALLAMLGAGQRAGEGRSGRFTVLLVLLVASAAVILPRAVRTPEAATDDAIAAQPWSEAALAAARAQGHPVFAYFTADWCLTCKVNERLAIGRAETQAAFAKAGVVVLRGDWTRRDPAISRALSAHGAAGVPLYLWYPAGGGAERQLPQVLTPALLAALPGADKATAPH